jgi:hypothetical protein
MADEVHRWVVDSIEERVASIEIDGSSRAQVPSWVLPPGVKEGDVLAVRHEVENGGARSTLRIDIDREATRLAFEASSRQVRKGEPQQNDPGGDIRF